MAGVFHGNLFATLVLVRGPLAVAFVQVTLDECLSTVMTPVAKSQPSETNLLVALDAVIDIRLIFGLAVVFRVARVIVGHVIRLVKGSEDHDIPAFNKAPRQPMDCIVGVDGRVRAVWMVGEPDVLKMDLVAADATVERKRKEMMTTKTAC